MFLFFDRLFPMIRCTIKADDGYEYSYDGFDESSTFRRFGNRYRQSSVLQRYIVCVFRKNLNASKPSEHPPQVEECLKV